MKRYLIEDAKCGTTENAIAFGSVSEYVVVTVQFKEEDTTKWLSVVEAEGYPNVYLFDKDVHDELVKNDIDDEEFTDYMDDHYLDEFEDIELYGEYDDIFYSFAEDPENPAIPLIRYIFALVRCDRDDVEKIIEMAKGRYVDELDIPISDVEENYFSENEE